MVTPNINELISQTSESARVRRAVVKDKVKLWKQARVPYTIDPLLRKYTNTTQSKQVHLLC